jgi:hypothetical protein
LIKIKALPIWTVLFRARTAIPERQRESDLVELARTCLAQARSSANPVLSAELSGDSKS